jgi:hypothetical protein
MLSLSWPEVQAMLTNPPPPPSMNLSSPDLDFDDLPNNRSIHYNRKIQDSAADYIARILHNQAEARSPQNKLQQSMPASRDMNQPTEIAKPATMNPPESWRRISLAPGVELHLREPYASAEKENIDQLIQIARQLFQNPRK